MKVLTTFTLLLMISAVGVAQDDTAQDSTQQQSNATISTKPQSGSPRGEVPPDVPGERTMPKNSVQVGVNVNGSYDSLGNTNQGGEATVGEGMVFRLNNETPNRRTVFQYQPSYTYGTGGDRNTFSQVFDGDAYFRMGKRWTLRLQDSYRRTTDPFSQGTQFSNSQAPNNTVATPYVNQKSETAVAELDWLAGKHTSVGFVGNFALAKYGEVAGLANSQQPLLDSTNSSGRVFVRHAFTKRFSAGLEGQYQDLFIGDSFSRTQSYSAILYTSFQLTKHSQLTLYGGPQRSHLRNQIFVDLGFFVIPLNVVKWSTDGTGGANYSLLMKHGRVFVNYSNRITDGGGLMGAVTLNNVSAGYERAFSPRWSSALAFDFGNNKALATQNTLRSYAGTVTVRRKVTRDMNFSVSYQNLNQSQTPQQFAGFISGDRNRVFASLEYVWTHPLGR
jgi:hypothetical protein